MSVGGKHTCELCEQHEYSGYLAAWLSDLHAEQLLDTALSPSGAIYELLQEAPTNAAVVQSVRQRAWAPDVLKSPNSMRFLYWVQTIARWCDQLDEQDSWSLQFITDPSGLELLSVSLEAFNREESARTLRASCAGGGDLGSDCAEPDISVQR